MATQLKVNFTELAIIIFYFFELGAVLTIFAILKSGYNVGKLSNVCILAIAMIREIKKNINDM